MIIFSIVILIIWLPMFRVVTNHEKKLDDEAQIEFLHKYKNERSR